ncbi:hypothetical protein FM107_02550 [Sphingobacterium sp. JB170]|nr:hypothetical protein FM107_02550 [Sphingobacterium sp. JB170]
MLLGVSRFLGRINIEFIEGMFFGKELIHIFDCNIRVEVMKWRYYI